MFALSQKQTLRFETPMSAFSPKADMDWCSPNVRFVPKADSCGATKKYIYSIISSARARSIGGASMPTDFAVCTLMTNSKLVGSSEAVSHQFDASGRRAESVNNECELGLQSLERQLRRVIHRDRAAVGAFGDRGSTIVVTSPVRTS